jgi:hypothetical protein
VFKSSVAKIIIIVLFLKIKFIMDFDDFYLLNYFTLLFELNLNFRSTSADPSRHTSVLRHIG